MAWKIERWLADTFPGEQNIYSEYRSLPSRELAIVSAAVLDVALAELLSLRLNGQSNEIEEFLGLNADGRAPAGSFGARIQLGILVGLLTQSDAAILRRIKDLRNAFAHRVRVDFLSPQVIKITTALNALWIEKSKSLIETGIITGSTDQLNEIGRLIPSVAEAGEGLLLAIFTVYQAYFHRMHSKIERIGRAV